MSIQPTCEPTPHRRRAACTLLSLSMLVAVSAFALLSPGDARSDECLGNDPACGGGQPPPPPPPPPAPPPPPPPPGEGGGDATSCSGAVVLYEHANYQGQCWGFPAGQTDYVGDGANERASSIWVADGYVATL